MKWKCGAVNSLMEHPQRSSDNATPFLIDRRVFCPVLLHD
jgi:hypothetical protein